MIAIEQIIYLRQRVKIFNHAESLYTMDTKFSLTPHIYGKEINDYIEWMYNEELVIPECYEMKDDFADNYTNDEWYKMLSQKQIIQCLGVIIRQDRFNDGLILHHIKDGTFEKLINQLTFGHNGEK